MGSCLTGNLCVLVMSFEPSLRDAMGDSLSKKEAISVVDCQVRRGLGSSSEILMSKFSKVQTSPKRKGKLVRSG